MFQGKGFVFFEGELEKLFQPRGKGQPFELSEGDLAMLFQEEVTFNMVSPDEYLASLEDVEFKGDFNGKPINSI